MISIKTLLTELLNCLKQIENILKDEPLFEKYANYLKIKKMPTILGEV